MEDRYAGDVGDFLKLGLLRSIAAGDGSAAIAPLTVGVNWYLTPNETAGGDGGFISYLSAENSWHARLQKCDPELMAALRGVVREGRSVQALEDAGALPPGAATFRERLIPGQDGRTRQAWHASALRALSNVDVMFADPDNGIAEASPSSRIHKYALLSELADYAVRGQSLIAYHHADRSGPAQTQARNRLSLLASGTGLEPVGTIIGRRGNTRFFLVCASKAHASQLSALVAAFATAWSPHVELVEA